MTPHEILRATWCKSTRSTPSGGNCVEVAVTPDIVGVRDTKDREGGTLVFQRERWMKFLSSLKG